MDNYTRGKVLGKGSFGSAILVTNKKDGKNYVIKEIDISRMPAAEREASKQEARLLMALKHPNIVKCLDTFTHNNKLCIVMDWCSEGDIYNILQKRKPQQLSEDTILDWFVQMCLGLKHVHDRKILHRDIKTQNIFMSAGGLLKLGDFGVSKILASTWQLAATAVGTPYYLSPEICQNKKYNQKSDIWSLGCVLYELSTMKHAFEAPNMRALIQKIVRGSYNPLPTTRSKELRDLIDRMLTLDYNRRPTINDVLATPVVKARIQKFLSATLHANEFSHTIIHGRPKAGQIVVASALPTPAFSDPKPLGGGGAGGVGGGVGSAAAAAAAGRSPAYQAPTAAAVAAAAAQRQAALFPKGASPAVAAAAGRLGAGVGAAAKPPVAAAGACRPSSANAGGRAAVPVRMSDGGRAVAKPAPAAIAGGPGIRASSPALAAAAAREKDAAAARLKVAQEARERASKEAAAIRERAAAAQKEREEKARREKEAMARKLREAAEAREKAAALQRESEAAAARAREEAARKVREAAAAREREAAEQRAKLVAAQKERADAAARERDAAVAREKEAAEHRAKLGAAAKERAAALSEEEQAAVKKREEAARKAREIAAMGAQREIERLKLEDQRKRLEQDRQRMDADKRRAEVKRAEDAKAAKAAEEVQAKVAAEEEKKAKEVAAKKRKEDEEKAKREAERQAREKERGEMRAKIAAQKKEFQERQQAAAAAAAAQRQQAAEVRARTPPARPVTPPDAGAAAGGAPARPVTPPLGAALRPVTPPAAAAARPWGRDKDKDRDRDRDRDGDRGSAGRAAAQPRQRKQWVSLLDEEPSAGALSPEVEPQWRVSSPPEGHQRAEGRGAAARSGGDLTPEQRRAVYEEMREAARRNRQHAADYDRPGGDAGGAGQGVGLAAFLGVPPPGREASPSAAEPSGRPEPGPVSPYGAAAQEAREGRLLPRLGSRGELGPPAAAGAGAGAGVDPLSVTARRNAAPTPKDGAYYERKQRRLEEERAAREAQLRDFQRQHYHEVKEAAERNRRAVRGQLTGDPPSPPPGQADRAGAEREGAAGGRASGGPSPEPSRPMSPAPEAEDVDFAAMVKDMQDILMQAPPSRPLSASSQHARPMSARQVGGGAGSGAPSGPGSRAASPMAGGARPCAPRGGAIDEAALEATLAGGDGDDDDDSGDDVPSDVLAGRFLLDGQVVQLDVQDSDPLGVKVEALRMYLEEKLGTNAFLKVYRRLESLSMEDDEAEVSREFLNVLGPERLPYLQLVHQLIVCEEQWEACR